MNQQWPQFLRLDYLILYCVVFSPMSRKKYFFHEFCCHKYDIYMRRVISSLTHENHTSHLAAIAFRFFDIIVSFLITALLIIITFCSFQCYTYTQGGYSGFQVMGMIEWSQKSRPKKIPRASSKTQKNPWTKKCRLLYNTCDVKRHHS